ncbi:hypothetical protein LT85_4220 [Collimonas arenae]|uniref:Uncharacterized protein n=1 Tax=Collimonas arenae TaxID=279058 RepID=A0A0A1FF48_9BURK|nr:hypothetical protein LT85_4220 [Collimonas arenae]
MPANRNSIGCGGYSARCCIATDSSSAGSAGCRAIAKRNSLCCRGLSATGRAEATDSPPERNRTVTGRPRALTRRERTIAARCSLATYCDTRIIACTRRITHGNRPVTIGYSRKITTHTNSDSIATSIGAVTDGGSRTNCPCGTGVGTDDGTSAPRNGILANRNAIAIACRCVRTDGDCAAPAGGRMVTYRYRTASCCRSISARCQCIDTRRTGTVIVGIGPWGGRIHAVIVCLCRSEDRLIGGIQLRSIDRIRARRRYPACCHVRYLALGARRTDAHHARRRRASIVVRHAAYRPRRRRVRRCCNRTIPQRHVVRIVCRRPRTQRHSISPLRSGGITQRQPASCRRRTVVTQRDRTLADCIITATYCNGAIGSSGATCIASCGVIRPHRHSACAIRYIRVTDRHSTITCCLLTAADCHRTAGRRTSICRCAR